uniref:Uncharacterized protein n=1 Tax=Trichogramma kaykai TaxID=54128 RepID=A0ABD2XGB5_9HYME
MYLAYIILYGRNIIDVTRCAKAHVLLHVASRGSFQTSANMEKGEQSRDSTRYRRIRSIWLKTVISSLKFQKCLSHSSVKHGQKFFRVFHLKEKKDMRRGASSKKWIHCARMCIK